jgi:hypothetical protein
MFEFEFAIEIEFRRLRLQKAPQAAHVQRCSAQGLGQMILVNSEA